MIGVDISPLLKINRVVVTGELGCDIELRSGINIIKAEAYMGDTTASNDCGKTTFTNLIKYGLGDRNRFSTGELAKKIDQLFLEIELNDEVLTIRRDLNKFAARIHIFQHTYHPHIMYDTPDIQVDPQTPFSDLLLERLGIPRVSVPLSKKPGSFPVPITMQNFLRILYMDQKNSFQEIMYKVQPEWLKRKTVEILLGMSKEEVEQMNLKIQKLTNEIDILRREVESIRDFLLSSGGTNRLEITEKREEELKEYNALSTQIDGVKQSMRGEKGITDQLREELERVNYRLVELEESKAKILLKMKDFQALRNSLLVDREKIQKTDEASHLLSPIDVIKCPRCLQRITAEMRRREVHGNCKLCGRPLLTETITKTKILGKEDAVNEEIKEVEILLNQYTDDLQQITSKIAHLSREKTRLQQELDRQSQSYVSPFIDELERLLYQRNQISTELELLNQQLRQWKVLEQREQRLDELQKEQHKIQILVAKIDTYDASKIRKLSEYYESFLRRVEYPGLNTARIRAQDLMPLVNGNIYTEDTGSGMQSVKIIAYHYSLLEFSLDNPCYYPRFLMLDSPRVFDLNPDTYEKLLLQFHRLPEKFDEEKFQIILTTRDLPEKMEQYVIERINSKNRMLLRPEGQRE